MATLLGKRICLFNYYQFLNMQRDNTMDFYIKLKVIRFRIKIE